MKRMLVLLLALMLIIPLASCGEPEKDHSDLYGTWKVSYIESDGSEFSVEEWEESEGDDYSKYAIVIKSNGEAGVVEDDFTWDREWYVVGNTIVIGSDEYEISGDVLRFDDWGNYICYEKVSSNQTVPKVDNDDTVDNDSNTLEETVESAPSNNTNDSAEWRDFLKEYEEWADKYIAVVKKQKANPSDLSILTEYTQLVTELAEWTEKADEVSDSITDVKEAAEYSAEVMRIAAKIAKAAEEL